ncbi:MAG: single-stranded-DNA-specific exonuclease RecJ [Rhodospirillaceae bacterium]
MSEIGARVLAARGILPDDVPLYLEPTLRDLLPDPDKFHDMARGAERLATAIMQDECIGIFGDYDVDGATSAALLTRFIRAAGGRTAAHIPDRIAEGYGPNAPAILNLKDRRGCGVVVTVDCGTLSFGPLREVRDGGLDVIVVDHHTAESELPPALAVINPNRMDEVPGYGQLAAVGVAFLLAVAVNRTLRDAGWYRQNPPEPNLLQWLDMVALGTVCDVVPLTGINRALVLQGLKVLAARRLLGLRALADVAGIDETPSAYHLGFILGPRINAGGRVGEADLGYRLLTTEHEDEAWHLARKLDALNKERQDIELGVLDAALRRMTDAAFANSPTAIADGASWHPGVIGIVASRLKERFNRPACVISWDGETGVGSGRSVKGVDLGTAIIAARQAGLLEKGGGHAMAAGFTVTKQKFGGFMDFLNDRVAAAIADVGMQANISVDGYLRPGGANLGLAEELAALGPFGSGNPEPRFIIPDVRLTYCDVVGQNHVKCRIAKEDGGNLDGIAFRALDSELGAALLEHDGRRLNLVGKIRSNSWMGRVSPQLQIEDAGYCGG